MEYNDFYDEIPNYLKELLGQWKAESKFDGTILYKIDHRERKLILYTYGIGYLIGKAGSLVNKYEKILKGKYNINDIEFVETGVRCEV